ncbi:MAG: XTP/dITP diphosphatase [Lachnospiraceae bacterium]|nr:XTP/dITP diphosphatase [Lachnospiraceae bacterium]
MKVIMATGNKNKVREVQEILQGTGIEIISMKDAGVDVEIIENGKTFEENAAIKAETVCAASGCITIADDSGLEVDWLGGAPGIYSSRFMCEDTSYDIKNAAIIEKLKDAKGDERSARFICAMAIAYPDAPTKVFKGVFEGQIAYAPAGPNGFGYDPIFYVPELGCTSAELSEEEKNAVSHRGKALRLAAAALTE